MKQSRIYFGGGGGKGGKGRTSNAHQYLLHHLLLVRARASSINDAYIVVIREVPHVGSRLYSNELRSLYTLIYYRLSPSLSSLQINCLFGFLASTALGRK
jgi:hypothetical protein